MLNTLIIGASNKPQRYAYKALQLLKRNNIPIYALGRQKMYIDGTEVFNGKPFFSDVHTVTLYLNAKNQVQYYNYIINLKPKRVIFNPGTENQHFKEKLRSENIEVLEACTLVLLTTNQYKT